MKWSPAFATGVPQIDEQHKMIFRMSEDFQAALETGGGERVYSSLLSSLELYAKSHFRFEENCMARFRCPVADRNKAAHAAFIETLERFGRRFEVTGFDPHDALTLMHNIDDWLSNHIGRIDVHLKASVEGADQGGGAAPVEG